MICVSVAYILETLMKLLLTVATPVMGLGAKPPPQKKCRLDANVKQAGQELGVNSAEIFKFCSFLQSKSVNNISKLLQLLGTSSRRTPTGASPGGSSWIHGRSSPLNPTGELQSPRPLGLQPPTIIAGAATETHH